MRHAESTTRRKAPFVMIPSELLRSRIGPAPIAVWAALRSYADNESMTAWPNMLTLAQDTGCSERTVKRAIQTLRLAGWVSVKKRYGKSNVYLLHTRQKCLSRANMAPKSGQYGPSELDPMN